MNKEQQLSFFLFINLLFVFGLKAIRYDNLDPKIGRFLTELAKKGGPPIYKMAVKDARKVLEDLQAKSVNTVTAEIKDIVIPGKITKDISFRIIRPISIKAKLPVIIYLHGGGWILGSKNTHDRLVRQIANNVGAAVVFVDYTPSPEAQYPVAIEQAYEVLKYISQNAAKLNLDSKRIAVVGDSVGGNMATVLTLLAKQRNGPKILYQVLFYPVTDANFNTNSYNQFANGPWLTKAAMQWFWDAYMPDKTARLNPTVSPLRATIDQLRGLPPVLVITDENDVLRDEGEAYAHKLMQAGVDVTAIRYLGTMHDFVMLEPLADTTATKSAISLATQKLKEKFNQ